MNNYYRIIDANINRASEGIRVLEDSVRFLLGNKSLANELRLFRHKVRNRLADDVLLQSRDIKNDVGVIVSQETTLDMRHSLRELQLSNMKRVQEGLRTIEETLKLLDGYEDAKYFERLRYHSYYLEMQILKPILPNNEIYLILSEAFSCGKNNAEVLKEALEAGIKIVQYREKDKSKKEQIEECLQLVEMVKEVGGIFIINDHLDIAMLVGAHGVHLGQDDLDIKHVKKIAPGMIVGKSTHNLTQAILAEQQGADYIGVGPIYETSTKKNIEKSEGLHFLKQVSKTINIPYVAIGGIKKHHLKTIKKHGANPAMITEIVSSKDVKGIIAELYKELI